VSTRSGIGHRIWRRSSKKNLFVIGEPENGEKVGTQFEIGAGIQSNLRTESRNVRIKMRRKGVQVPVEE